MSLREHIDRVTSATPPTQQRDLVLYHGVRTLIGAALALATYLLFPAAPAVDLPLYEVGSVATENVIAPFGFTVRKADAQLQRERDELARAAEPVFVYSPVALDSSQRRLRALSAAIANAAPTGTPMTEAVPAVQSAAAGIGVQLTPEEAAYLTSRSRRQAVEQALDRTFRRWLAGGVVAGGALDDVRGTVILKRGETERRVHSDSLVTFGGMLARARLMQPDPDSELGRAVFTKLLTALFHPTIVPDRVATEKAREELRRSVPEDKYEIRPFEKIIGANEVVGREEHEKLRALRDEIQLRKGGQRILGRVVGAILFNFLVIAIIGITLVLFRPQLYRSLRALTLFAIVYFLVLGASAIIAHTVQYPELIPIALAAVIFSVLFDPRISMIASMILAVLIGGQSVFRGTNALFLNLIGGAAAAFSVRVLRRRTESYSSILTIAGAYFLAALALGLTLSWEPSAILRSAGLGTLNAALSVPIAMALLPLAEEFTGIDTDLKLLEWSDLNRPLMRRLSLEAPGTYAHTMAIANLAEAACNAIEANGLLARVGAYYHDIGKMKKPQYFVENQPKGRNPHDKLKPNTSAAIIKGHIREGLELADEYRVPKAIRAFITEHHGTGQISYFLDKARERDGAVSNPVEFAYPGPLPQTAETAVVMLADGVEAATRVIQEPTPHKIREVVDHIVRMRMEQGQLREAPLTLRQLDIIKEQFARVLIGMHHNRIDYPASSGGVSAEFASL